MILVLVALAHEGWGAGRRGDIRPGSRGCFDDQACAVAATAEAMAEEGGVAETDLNASRMSDAGGGPCGIAAVCAFFIPISWVSFKCRPLCRLLDQVCKIF
jgi:hypothetical protein